MTKFLAVLVLAAATALLAVFAGARQWPATTPDEPVAALSRTFIALSPSTPLQFPPLVSGDGSSFTPIQLQGHWSLVFFGFTACPLVCPTTLAVLTAVAHNAESGIAAGTTKPLFVSVDPEHDTPERMSTYLKQFDSHISGVTGTRNSVSSFAREIGAGYLPVGSALDHSTSLFVVDPKGRLVGVLLHPSKPSIIVADLSKLRRDYNSDSR